LGAKRIRLQESMIRWLEFDGHRDIAETGRSVLQAFVKTQAIHVVRRYKASTRSRQLNLKNHKSLRPKQVSTSRSGEIWILPDGTNPGIASSPMPVSMFLTTHFEQTRCLATSGRRLCSRRTSVDPMSSRKSACSWT
jgi:hypothetical protein